MQNKAVEMYAGKLKLFQMCFGHVMLCWLSRSRQIYTGVKMPLKIVSLVQKRDEPFKRIAIA